MKLEYSDKVAAIHLNRHGGADQAAGGPALGSWAPRCAGEALRSPTARACFALQNVRWALILSRREKRSPVLSDRAPDLLLLCAAAGTQAGGTDYEARHDPGQ